MPEKLIVCQFKNKEKEAKDKAYFEAKSLKVPWKVTGTGLQAKEPGV
jgi:hypothetical protein